MPFCTRHLSSQNHWNDRVLATGRAWLICGIGMIASQSLHMRSDRGGTIFTDRIANSAQGSVCEHVYFDIICIASQTYVCMNSFCCMHKSRASTLSSSNPQLTSESGFDLSVKLSRSISDICGNVSNRLISLLFLVCSLGCRGFWRPSFELLPAKSQSMQWMHATIPGT